MPIVIMCKQTIRCPNCKFRNSYGYCMILNNTSFDKKCPFYKTNKYKDKDNETNTDNGTEIIKPDYSISNL